ncbi:hypothetical protein L6R52_42050, partial [Myxococcota bacterium]|nr:hypothetical protein [Myxococcota bacterium]
MRSGPHLALVLARRRALFAGALAASSVLVFELVARVRDPAGAPSILVALVHALGLGLGSALLAHATGAGPRGRGPGVLEARRAAVAALDAPTAALTFFSSGLVTAIAAHGVTLGWARLEATLHTLLRAHSAAIVAFAGCLAIAGARAATRPSRSGGAT